jgi:hypothetical protein
MGSVWAMVVIDGDPAPDARKVREDRTVEMAVGCPNKAPARLYAKSRQKHDASYPFVIDYKSMKPELVCHASATSAGQFILDVFDDRSPFGIR